VKKNTKSKKRLDKKAEDILKKIIEKCGYKLKTKKKLKNYNEFADLVFEDEKYKKLFNIEMKATKSEKLDYLVRIYKDKYNKILIEPIKVFGNAIKLSNIISLFPVKLQADIILAKKNRKNNKFKFFWIKKSDIEAANVLNPLLFIPNFKLMLLYLYCISSKKYKDFLVTTLVWGTVKDNVIGLPVLEKESKKLKGKIICPALREYQYRIEKIIYEAELINASEDFKKTIHKILKSKNKKPRRDSTKLCICEMYSGKYKICRICNEIYGAFLKGNRKIIERHFGKNRDISFWRKKDRWRINGKEHKKSIKSIFLLGR